MGMWNLLDGYKTYIGGVGSILIGAGTAGLNYYNGVPTDWNVIAAYIIAGITIIGGGHKLAKLKI